MPFWISCNLGCIYYSQVFKNIQEYTVVGYYTLIFLMYGLCKTKLLYLLWLCHHCWQSNNNLQISLPLILCQAIPLAVAPWRPWEEWSHCSLTCDTGVQIRRRQCQRRNQCVGIRAEAKKCKESDCSKLFFFNSNSYSLLHLY